MKQITTITFLFLCLSVFSQDNSYVTKTYPKATAINADKETETKILTTKDNEVVPTADTETVVVEDTNYHEAKEETKAEIYAKEWKEKNPSYNQLVAENYKRNSTNPFASELRQLESVGKIALTSESLKIISSMPYLKVY